MNKLKKRPLILFVIALIGLYVIIYIIPTVTGALVSSYTVEYGEMKIADQTDGYLVREETVYVAGSGGSANRYIENGTLVRGGTTVMEVSGSGGSEVDAKYTDMLARLGSDAVSTADYTVKKGGVVSYYADGYESKIRPDNMEKGSYSYYSKLSQDSVVNLERKTVAQGEPVFKVVDRTQWYLVCFVPLSSMERYEEGMSVTVEFEDDFVEAQVYSVSEDKDGQHARIILSVGNYYDKYTQMRVCSVSLVTYENRGLLVESGSIVEEKGQQGVYVKNKTNDYIFVPIKVYASDGEYALVADTMYQDEEGEQVMTVEIYDQVLKNPQ